MPRKFELRKLLGTFFPNARSLNRELVGTTAAYLIHRQTRGEAPALSDMR